MKIMIKVFTTAIFALSLTGCATYTEPSDPGAATIQGASSRDGLATWDSVELTFIDNKSLGMRWSSDSKFNISPGAHRVTVDAAFNRGFTCGGPYYTIMQIPFVAKPNTHYIVRSAPDGAIIKAWIENSETAQKVSAIKSEKYEKVPQESTPIVYIPPSK